MSKTRPRSIILVIICTLFTSVAQLLYKKGSELISWNLFDLITNYWLIGGLSLYAIGAVLLIVALRGGEVSVIYPIIATSYVWVSFLSMFFLGETISIVRWGGIAMIFLGVWLIGKGSVEKKPLGVEI